MPVIPTSCPEDLPEALFSDPLTGRELWLIKNLGVIKDS